MNVREFATLFIRFLSLYIIVQFLSVLPQLATIPFFSEGHRDNPMAKAVVASILLNVLLHTGTAALLWIFSRQLGEVLSRGIDEEEKLKVSLDLAQGQQLGIFLIGIYLLSFTIPECVKVVFNPAIDPSHGTMATDLMGKAKTRFSGAELIFLLGKLLVGITLVLGSRGLVGLICKVRSFGRFGETSYCVVSSIFTSLSF